MAGASQFVKPFAMRDAAGNVIYEGAAAYLAGMVEVVSSESSATMTRGEAAVVDGTATFGKWARWGYSTAGTDALPQTQLACKRTQASAGADVGFLGVALESIPAGAAGRLAGPGSMLSVKTTATLIAAGALLSSSATAGLVAAAATKSATVPAYGTVLGVCIIINQVATPGSGSTGEAGVLVSPS